MAISPRVVTVVSVVGIRTIPPRKKVLFIAVRMAVVRSSYLVGIMVQAKEYKFQVKNDPGSDNENILFLNADNIELLQAAIDTPSERRVLRPDHVLRREAREHRGR